MPTHYFAIDRTLADVGTFEMRLHPFVARLAIDDMLVVFERMEADIEFIGTCKVLKASDHEEEAGNDGRRITVRAVEVSEIDEFESRQSLIVLSGSLEKIRRFLEPYRHFQQKVVKLSKLDFDTIRFGRVYMGRSIFRALFTALPLAVQAEFVRQHIEDFPLTTDGTISDYRLLAPSMVNFLMERLNEPLHMLALIAEMHGGRELPSIIDLYLTDGGDPEGARVSPVAFGKACDAARGLQAGSKLLWGLQADDGPMMETLSRLDELDTDGRQWNDPIF